jgi:hypothetical protein
VDSFQGVLQCVNKRINGTTVDNGTAVDTRLDTILGLLLIQQQQQRMNTPPHKARGFEIEGIALCCYRWFVVWRHFRGEGQTLIFYAII